MATTKVVESVLVGKDLVENDWPFIIMPIALADLFPDNKYQRPPQKAFINGLVAKFDPTLVGTLDVSDRADGRYAILDGLQRREVLRIVGKKFVWCAVYSDMTLADEARFFYRRNRDRKAVHPFYQFRARVLMGEGKAQAIDRIVRSEGFRLHTSAGPDNYLAAIKAVEDAYGYGSVHRTESLSPTLNLIRRVMFGRERAKDGEMIRGLGRFFQIYSDDQLNLRRLEEILENYGATSVLGRARDLKKGMGSGNSRGYEVAQVLMELYNKGFSPKLPKKQLEALRK